jgi:branched-chain amino acid transport system permease protein
VSDTIKQPAFAKDEVVPAPARAGKGRWWRGVVAIIGVAALVYLPTVLTDRAIFGVRLSNMQLLNLGLTQINLMLISMLGALSLNYLTGSAGLISIGHGAFYATGAMAAAVTGTQLGWPFPLVLLSAAAAGAVIGVLAGLPSLRVRGLYFVLSTMAAHYIVVFAFLEYQLRFFDVVGVPYATPSLGPFELNSPARWYFFLLVLVVLAYLGLSNTLRTREGRALLAMRDHERAAVSAGVDVRVLRIKVFGLSSAIAGVAGALYAYYLSNATAESFGITFAIQFIAMIIVGGMGSLPGALLGAAVWLLLPSIIGGFASEIGPLPGIVGSVLTEHRAQFVQLIFGVLVIVLLIFAPGGLAGLGRQLQGLLFPKRGD